MSMNRIVPIIILALCAMPHAARADVQQVGADGFFITFSAPVAAPATTAYADIVQVQRWWSGDHTWSGKSANLSIKAEAGGCFCERWKDGSVEHGRVVMAIPGKVLRMETSLGPLQDLALKGVLSFWVKTEDSATTLTVEYRVNGASTSGLDQLAPSVDEVLGLQVDRLRRYIATGNPEAPPEEKAAEVATTAAKKEALTDDEIAARVAELRDEIQNGNLKKASAGKPPPRAPDVPTPIPTKP
jgi:uncharacterized protein YndB with AHSA1/START domain